jgi:hypothetical protein
LEIIVSFAILAVVAGSVVAAVLGMVGMQQHNDQVRASNAAAEASLASGDRDAASSVERTLDLGTSEIPGTIYTYDEDSGGYTLLDRGSAATPSTVNLDGGPDPDVPVATPVKRYVVQMTGYYKLEVWGASGGDASSLKNGVQTTSSSGGAGGYATGIVRLTQGTTLYLTAGGKGSTSKQFASGGYNGGGNGGYNNSTDDYSAGSGGGASDVRIDANDNDHRVIVAGGGGGAGPGADATQNAGTGGFGGGLSGANGTGATDSQLGTEWGGGGNQVSGGVTASDRGDTTNGPGSFGQGGHHEGDKDANGSLITDRNRHGGGGGGGWYGGGAGSFYGGGGGSGWIFTQTAYTAWKSNNDKDANKYALSSQYWLKNADLIPGSDSMPNPREEGQTMTGMRGNGYVRISWVGTTPGN